MSERPDQPNSILIVDADREVHDWISRMLAESNIRADSVTTIEQALSAARARPPKLVISDLVLPDGSGFSLFRSMRQIPGLENLPIVAISRWAAEPDRILAFETGADDFVPKPFFPRELMSRVHAILRRSAWRSGEPSRRSASSPEALISLDPDRSELVLPDRRVELTPIEFSLLEALLRGDGRVLHRNELLAAAYGPDKASPSSSRKIDTHIKTLRRKLGETRSALQTVRGVGYRLSERLGPRDAGH